MNLNLVIKQRQQLNTSQLQNIEILAMDNIELNHFLQNEYLENPLMEHTEKNSLISSEPLSIYYEPTSNNYSDIPYENDEIKQRIQNIPQTQEENLPEHLLHQLNSSDYSAHEWQVFKYLIDCLDDSGYFQIPLFEIALCTGVSEPLIQHCLSILKQLEPHGIFASSLQECLLIQLNFLDFANENIRQIIENHLEDIASGKINFISKTLNISTSEVRKNIEIINMLNPRPLSGFNTVRNTYVTPDIILKKEEGNWIIELNDSWIENYSLNDYYLKMMETTLDSELADYFKNKYTRLQFVFNSIQQRRQTILTIHKHSIKIFFIFICHKYHLQANHISINILMQ